MLFDTLAADADCSADEAASVILVICCWDVLVSAVHHAAPIWMQLKRDLPSHSHVLAAPQNEDSQKMMIAIALTASEHCEH